MFNSLISLKLNSTMPKGSSNEEKQSNKVNSNRKYAMLHLRFTSRGLLKINYQLINYCSRQRIEEGVFQCKRETKIPTWCRPNEDTAFQQYSIFLPATITAKFCSWVMISYQYDRKTEPSKNSFDIQILRMLWWLDNLFYNHWLPVLC